MPGNDEAIRVRQNRIGEAERSNGRNNLLDLPLWMGSRIPWVGQHAGDRSIDDHKRRRPFVINSQLILHTGALEKHLIRCNTCDHRHGFIIGR